MAAGDFLSGIELISPSEFAKKKIQSIQDYSILAAESVANLFRRPRYLADMVQQMDLIGFGSLPIVLASVFFTGAALALNSAITLKRFGATTVIGQLVSIGIIRELGPVLAGLVVAGRNSSGMASELGSMIVTEQIDAMRALGTDPIQKLVTPRLIALAVVLPLLTIISDFIGLVGGYFIATFTLGLTFSEYWTTAWQALEYNDLFQGLLKPFVFAVIIALVGCFYGMRTSGGTQGVGRATTRAVVSSSVWIFVLTAFITYVWNRAFAS
jgi:phospholipid/cholesterol/gamma-HCH transport system permease protein